VFFFFVRLNISCFFLFFFLLFFCFVSSSGFEDFASGCFVGLIISDKVFADLDDFGWNSFCFC